MRTPTLALVAVLVLAAPLAAQANKKATAERMIESARIQEQRATDLEAIARWDAEASRSLSQHAAATRKHADWMDERAKEYKDTAMHLPDSDATKRELMAFAADMANSARADRDFAVKREELSRTLAEQNRAASTAAREHRQSADKLRAMAAKLQK